MSDDIQKAFEWLFGRDTGMSSKAIMGHMVAGVSDGSWPSDPADLGRCLRLIAQFPAWEDRIWEMGKYGPVWASYSQSWGRLKAMYIEESGDINKRHGWSAPKTYELMSKLRVAARNAA